MSAKPINANQRHIAYFSMEIGLKSSLPTYSGGLGVLAGDTLKSAADLGLPVVAVSLLHRKGYFRQSLDRSGQQSEAPVEWRVEDELTPLEPTANIQIEGRSVVVRAWRYDLKGESGHVVPILFLDTDLPENTNYDRTLSDSLYGGDQFYRISQEVLLGVGGFEMLKSLGYQPGDYGKRSIGTYHMNEGHASFLTLALLKHKVGLKELKAATPEDLAWAKDHCVFTTHTPVPAGHDRFDEKLVERVLGREITQFLGMAELLVDGELNMTHLALRFARFVNGVAKRHGEVSRQMFPGHKIYSITNGIHAATWAADGFHELFDRRIPLWRRDNFMLRDAWELPLDEIRAAHVKAKEALFAKIGELTGEAFSSETFTIGFARRAATYKRADLLLLEPARLAALAERFGGIQVVFAGKAHPKDEPGKALIKNVIQRAQDLAGSKVKFVYLANYDMDLGRLICAGVDLWLNNPIKPLEASGTSGMKAALNGVPSLSTLDGWWVEGHIENVTGWEVEDQADGMVDDINDREARRRAMDAIYTKLENVIVPMYYEAPDRYAQVMRYSIAINGSFFNTHRMMLSYAEQAYQRP